MLEMNNVTKRYGKKIALNQVSMKLEPGIYGLLGPNGAGKSTLMNILTLNLKPEMGSVQWDGSNIGKQKKSYLHQLGYAPQQQGLYDSFTGRRFLAYLGTLKEIARQDIRQEIDRAAAYVNLTDRLDDRIGSYSGGMKQRILVAQAVMGNPRLVILDEPTAGLDPRERVRIRQMISELARDRIILVATHVVSDVESVAKEIIILKEGNLVDMDTPGKLIEAYAPGENLEKVYMNLFGEESCHVETDTV